MIDETIDQEIAKLVSARAGWQGGDSAGAQNSLNQLDKKLLPAQLAAMFPARADPSQFIEQALAYYVSIFRLGYRAASVPEIPEDVIVNAINKYWKGTTAFYAAAVLVAALFGGTAVGLVQIQSASTTIQNVKKEANDLLAEAERTKADIESKAKGAVEKVDGSVAEVQKLVDDQKKDVAKKIGDQVDQSVTELKTKLKNAEDGHLKELANDFDGKKADFDAQAARKIDEAIKAETGAVKQQVADSVKKQSQAETDDILKNLRAEASSAERWAGLIEGCYSDYLTQAANPSVGFSRAAKAAEIKRRTSYCGTKSVR